MKKDLKIREVKMNDINQLTILFDMYRVFYKKESDIDGAKRFLLQRITNRESTIYVAENDQKQLLGFVQLYPIFSSTKMKSLWLLNDLYVQKQSRGQGVSKMLIDKAKELAKKTKSAGLILETAKDNLIGNILYPHVGFEIDTEHNFYSWTSK